MKQSLRTQLRSIKARLDALDEPKPKQYLFAKTRKELDEIKASKPTNAVIICWGFTDEPAA